jgi:hypothetical protein
MKEETTNKVYLKLLWKWKGVGSHRRSNEVRTILKIDYQEVRLLTEMCVWGRGS